jgi:multidrug efflux pump subunit AcrA (membrane-fusion protein)
VSNLLRDTAPLDVEATPRRVIWVAVAVGIAIIALLGLRLTQALTVKKSVTNKVSIPTVSVTQVGVSTVPTTIEIIGTINARWRSAPRARYRWRRRSGASPVP